MQRFFFLQNGQIHQEYEKNRLALNRQEQKTSLLLPNRGKYRRRDHHHNLPFEISALE
jgi:hypothetical protein